MPGNHRAFQAKANLAPVPMGPQALRSVISQATVTTRACVKTSIGSMVAPAASLEAILIVNAKKVCGALRSAWIMAKPMANVFVRCLPMEASRNVPQDTALLARAPMANRVRKYVTTKATHTKVVPVSQSSFQKDVLRPTAFFVIAMMDVKAHNNATLMALPMVPVIVKVRSPTVHPMLQKAVPVPMGVTAHKPVSKMAVPMMRAPARAVKVPMQG